MNTPPAVDLRPLPHVHTDVAWRTWMSPAYPPHRDLVHRAKHVRAEHLAVAALGLGAVVALTAAYISSGTRAADIPDWIFRAWHFGAPIVLAAAATLGFAPGCSRLVRALTILTSIAYALPAVLDRWGLPGFDGVPLKVSYGIAVLAALGGRLATRLRLGHRQSAV